LLSFFVFFVLTFSVSMVYWVKMPEAPISDRTIGLRVDKGTIVYVTKSEADLYHRIVNLCDIAMGVDFLLLGIFIYRIRVKKGAETGRKRVTH